MSKYRTKSTYICPYCTMAGWQKSGDFEAHIRKSHPNKDAKDTVRNWHNIRLERLMESELKSKR